jgi:dihydrofolate synthase/folylpolyglutamate synthase
MLAQIYIQSGFNVGCYTSPHLLRYNERVKINGIEVGDADLCEAFSAVDAARLQAGDEIQLTYFEVGTLAALWHFIRIGVDVAILEIGLGGRLDAVNAFEPDCSIVTAVDLDHQEFLGDNREDIGYEKAGVYRENIPAICGDSDPPKSLVTYAKKVRAKFQCIHHDFDWLMTDDGWQFLSDGRPKYVLPLPALKGQYQLNNAACALAAVESLQTKLPTEEKAIAEAMLLVSVAGRFQKVLDDPLTILDVAHNPHAALALANNLAELRLQQVKVKQSKRRSATLAVFAILSDKDIKGVVEAVSREIDVWYVASIDNIRGASARDVADIIRFISPLAEVKIFNTAADAFEQACSDAESCNDGNENDKIIVFGSFFTVANVMQYLNEQKNSHF